MYTCRYVYVYICLYVFIYVYMYVCIHVYMCICIYICVYICIYVCVHICTYLQWMKRACGWGCRRGLPEILKSQCRGMSPTYQSNTAPSLVEMGI